MGMSRIHCNSTIVVLHWCWMSLSHLPDVGTSDALVIYNEFLKNRRKQLINMIDIKMVLVKSLIGTKLDGVPGDRPEQKLIRSESRESVPILP